MRDLNQKGFTLVELMVVVAIIGILSAIAIPNFKKYQAKSKQSEAKLQLAGIYTTETAIFAEYDSYFSCLAAIGFDPGTTGYYSIGVADALLTGTNGNPPGCADGANNAQFAATKGTGGVTSTIGAVTAMATLAIAADTFTAGAAGQIMAGNNCDQWTIDELKVVTNTQSGLTGTTVCN